MISYDEAVGRVLDGVARPERERVGVNDSVARVLTDEVVSHAALPGFDYSAMDGYAVSSDSFHGDGPWALPLSGEARAGGTEPSTVRPGITARIFTGAALPEGADAVVAQEETTRDGDSVRFTRRPRAGACVRRRGEDILPGERIARAGLRVTPWHVAAFTAAEVSSVCVARRPHVSIVATGDELREPGEAPRSGTVLDALSPTLAALVRHLGAVPRVTPIARDNQDSVRAVISEALRNTDLVLTLGGVSVGDHDLVRSALEDLSVALDFWRVAIKPGKPVCHGRAPSGARVLGLPGNPSSALLTFALFGAPLVRALQGETRTMPRRFDARLGAAIERAPGRRGFFRATLDDTHEGLGVATPLPNQSSGSALSLAAADVIIDVGAEQGALPLGATVRCFRLCDV